MSNNEQIERQMAFILDQQARFTVDLGEIDRRIEALARADEANSEKIGKLSDKIADVSNKIGSLADAMLSLTNVVEKHDFDIAALINQGKETDERLNALIGVVERLISDRGRR